MPTDEPPNNQNVWFNTPLAARDSSKTIPPASEEQMWERLSYFLANLVPVAEEAGVKLAARPRDHPRTARRGGAGRATG